MTRSTSSLRPVRMMIGRSSDSRSRRAMARPSSSGSLRSRMTRSTISTESTRSMSAPVSATETLKSFSVRYSLIRSRIATSSSTTRMWASTAARSLWFGPFYRRMALESAGEMTAINQPRRQAAAYIAFALIYFGLAAYAAVLPIHARIPLFIWPAHGVALGVLLVAPMRRWPVYLTLVVAATIAAGLTAGESVGAIARTALLGAAEPLVVAAGLIRLSGRIQIDTVRGLASFLVGMVPLVAAMAMLDAAYSFVAFDAPIRQRWSMMFVSTMLGMLVTAPLILAWNREGYREAYA